MRIIFRLQIITILILAISCSTEDNQTPVTDPQKDIPDITLSASADLHPLFSEDGGTISLSFTANDTWSAALSNLRAAGWISVSPTSGNKGNEIITIAVKPNETAEELNATIILKSGKESIYIVVTQKQKDALTVTADKIQIEGAGGDFEVEVKANIDFEVELLSAWIKQSETRALKTTGLHFQAEKNQSGEPREGLILVRSTSLSDTVRVYQDFIRSITLTEKYYSLPDVGGRVDIEINSNVDYGTRFLSGAEWVSEGAARALSTHTMRFDVTPNESYEPRQAKILFFDKENEHLNDTVTIYQAYKGALIVGSGLYDITAVATQLEIQLQTNLAFEVSSSVDWIEKSTTRALQEYTLIFNIQENETYEPREGVIIIQEKNGERSQQITVKQKGAVDFNMAERDALMAFYAASNGPQWVNNTNWGSDKPLDQWYGVTLRDGRVTALLLDNNNLKGDIAESIGELEKMETLSLAENQLTGDITAIISGMHGLTSLNLSTNQLSGMIPVEIGELRNLLLLSLNDNYFTGMIPEGLINIQSLQTLRLRDNFLSGEIPSVIYVSDLWENVWNVDDILPQREGYQLTFATYESIDFSQDGMVNVLHRHTKGKGIKIVVMGDGYSDRMIADGTYMSVMRKAMEDFFALEPYRTYRDYFDFYAITAVSKNEYLDRTSNLPSAMGTVYDGNTISLTAALDGSRKYLTKMEELKKPDGSVSLSNVVAFVIMNNDVTNFRSQCWMYSDGYSIALCFQGGTEEGIVAHEVGGHGFAHLADEYIEGGNTGTIPQSDVSTMKSLQSLGWYPNVDITPDPLQVSWKYFLTDSRYLNEGIGVYEGAYYYPKGVYRPRQNSIMRYHWVGDGYNAPSRWAIFERIKQLAGEAYAFADFLAYDAVNRNSFRSENISVGIGVDDQKRTVTSPPVILDYPSSEIDERPLEVTKAVKVLSADSESIR